MLIDIGKTTLNYGYLLNSVPNSLVQCLYSIEYLLGTVNYEIPSLDKYWNSPQSLVRLKDFERRSLCEKLVKSESYNFMT